MCMRECLRVFCVARDAFSAALARPSEYYFVHLFVAAIASGVLDPSTPNLARMQVTLLSLF